MLLRWYVAFLVFLLVITPGIGYAVHRYVMYNPAKPGTFIGRMYEKSVKGKLLVLCAKTMDTYGKSVGTSAEAESDATCKCFTDDLFETLRDVPPGELDAHVNTDPVQRSAESIFNKCVNEVGLN